MSSDRQSLCVIIPTYNREEVLVDTIRQVLDLADRPDQFLVIDQSETHYDQTRKALTEFEEKEEIHWIKLDQPNIPAAMNEGLKRATTEIVLFLDDDIEIDSDLIRLHKQEYVDEGVDCVAGRVIQPWDQHEPLQESFRNNNSSDPDAFLFNSGNRLFISRFMGGNVSFRCEALLNTGGFDENYVKTAYRFEADCARRFVASGYRILYSPNASIRHLKARSGGTRVYGEHLTTIRPGHSVGRYYYLLSEKGRPGKNFELLVLPFKSVATRFHLRKPWWIPVTLFAEVSGAIWALVLRARGPRLLVRANG